MDKKLMIKIKNHHSSQVVSVKQGELLSLIFQLIYVWIQIQIEMLGDRYQNWKDMLYRQLGFEQVDQWLLKELLFPEWSKLGILINTFWGVVIFNAIIDQLKPIVWTLLVEIIKAATPHLGATALQLLNHTVAVWRALRGGLVEK